MLRNMFPARFHGASVRPLPSAAKAASLALALGTAEAVP
jgi:hypothetical protein